MSYEHQTYTEAEYLGGHNCSGFNNFQKHSKENTCCPFINDKGLIEGCDNANGIPLLFCPFCGKDLNIIKIVSKSGEKDNE